MAIRDVARPNNKPLPRALTYHLAVTDICEPMIIILARSRVRLLVSIMKRYDLMASVRATWMSQNDICPLSGKTFDRQLHLCLDQRFASNVCRDVRQRQCWRHDACVPMNAYVGGEYYSRYSDHLLRRSSDRVLHVVLNITTPFFADGGGASCDSGDRTIVFQ